MRRIAEERAKELSGVIVYLCIECGIMDYKSRIVAGGLKCEGCGYLMDTEEAE